MATFPYTPGYVFGETVGYAVTVHRFQDVTEQRYLGSRQRGLRFAYEFSRADSGIVAGITSFYLAHGGPRDTFTAVDHRDGTSHTVRFAAPTLDHLMGPIRIRRALRVEFVKDEGGTTPIATAYVAPTIAEFCDPVVPTSGVVAPDAAVQRDGWVWAGGPVTVTPTQRFLPLGGLGAPTSAWCDAEYSLPTGVTITALTLRVLDLGAAGSVQLQVLINSQAQALSVTANANQTTAVATASLVTSRGQLVCVAATVGAAASIAWGVGYTHPY